MDDDDDGEERQDQHDDQHDQPAPRTYSKRSLFGKTTRDLKIATLKTYLKFKRPRLKPFKGTLETTLNKLKSSPSTTLKLQHKQQIGNLTCKSKLNFTNKQGLALHSWDGSNNLSGKWGSSTLGLSSHLNSKGDWGLKLSHNIKFWKGWKWKSYVEGDFKGMKFNSSGFNAAVERKSSCQDPQWLKFIALYSQTLGFSLTAKLNSGKKKGETYYKGHFDTSEHHKFYLEHKMGYDPSSPEKTWSNSFTFNCQDSLGIGTLNGHIQFQNKALKTKQFRFVVECQKRWAFGIQRRNEVFELMMQKTKIGYSWLRKAHLSVGNRGLVGSCEGKVVLWRLPVDYSLSYKLKQIQNNFYDDSSLGFTFKCNI